MRVTKVEWKQLGRDRQFEKEIAMTLSDGTVLHADAEQKSLRRGEDLIFIISENVPDDIQANDDKYDIPNSPSSWTDSPEVVGLVSEFLHALKNGNFEEKAETR